MAVHFRLPDSLRMVRRVVQWGQCIREKSMVLTAVIQVQPLFTSKSLSCARLSNSRRLPLGHVGHDDDGNYDLIGRKPQDKCHENHPVQPKKPGKGVQKPGTMGNRVLRPTCTLAIIQIDTP